MMHYLIRRENGELLSTDLPQEQLDDAISFNKQYESDICPLSKKRRRQGSTAYNGLILYLCDYNPDTTNRVFKHQLEASKSFLRAFHRSYEELTNSEKKKTRRLKHNLSTYTSKIHQELFKLLPQDKISGSRSDQREVIKSILEKNLDHATTTLLRILKNSNLIKSEFDVYDFLHTSNPHIDPQKHSIHKVITLSLSPFWLDLVNKGISVNMKECDGEMIFDYKSMSSILCHVFDNATKYLVQDSEFSISVRDNNDFFDIVFDMISLRVKEDELEKIFEDGFSSDYSEKLGYAGTGVGMNVIRKLSDLNSFKLKFERKLDPASTIIKLNIPFDHNRLTISVPKKRKLGT